MKTFTEIAEMGEYRKKKKSAPEKVEVKKKKEEAPKAKAAPVTPITRKEIKDEPKSKPSFKPPKAKARPERKETSERRFRGFVAGPRETKKETTSKPTTSSFMAAPGKQGKNQKEFLRKQKAEKMKKDFKTRGEMSRHRKKYDVKYMNPTISQRLKSGNLGPKTAKEMKNISGGGKVNNKYFTGGMVNPSFGTDFDDR
jgi:hypothetical protein